MIELPHAFLPTLFAALLVLAQYRRMNGAQSETSDQPAEGLSEPGHGRGLRVKLALLRSHI